MLVPVPVLPIAQSCCSLPSGNSFAKENPLVVVVVAFGLFFVVFLQMVPGSLSLLVVAFALFFVVFLQLVPGSLSLLTNQSSVSVVLKHCPNLAGPLEQGLHLQELLRQFCGSTDIWEDVFGSSEW